MPNPIFPPNDIPGQIPPSPTNPWYNVYTFDVFLHSQQAPAAGWTIPGPPSVTVPPAPTGVSPGVPAGKSVAIIAHDFQTAYQAVVTNYGTDLMLIRGGTPTFVGAYLAGGGPFDVAGSASQSPPASSHQPPPSSHGGGGQHQKTATHSRA